MSSQKVSIIMNCFNGEKYLAEAIDSVFFQTYQDWEIIFWDNASTDNSVKVAQKYGDRVRIFNSEKTQSLGRARNLAINEARGEFIAFLDCDDIWFSQKLEKQMELFEKDPELGLVFSDLFLFNDKRTICQMYRKFKPPRGKIFEYLLKKYFLVMVSAVVRRSVVLDGLWFDERLSLLEDAFLFYKISYSQKVDYVDEPLAKYRIHFQSNTFQDYSKISAEREMILERWMSDFPKLKNDFPEGLQVYNNKTLQLKGLGSWIEGRPSKARKELLLISDSGVLKYFLYVLTYFPSALLFPLINLNHFLKNYFDWSRQ